MSALPIREPGDERETDPTDHLALHTDAGLDELFGTVERHTRPLTIIPASARDLPQLPTAWTMTSTQLDEAMDRIYEDTSNYPRFPWGELDEKAGLMCPEDLWMVAGRTGNGKSLFLLNLFDQLIESGRKVLYIGLEQSPKILRIKWASLRAGVPAARILGARQGEKTTQAYKVALEAILPQMRWQEEEPQCDHAHFAATRFVTRPLLTAWVEWAVDHECEIVIVDHVDRIDHGDGKNSFHEISQTIRLAKELATHHRIVMLMASQVGRPGDPLQKFQPPALQDLRGAGTKEEESDAVLAVYRPLKAGTTEDQMRKVRQGLMNEREIYDPDLMAVKVLKHRLDGDMTMGTPALLNVHAGRLTNRSVKEFGRYSI